MARQTAINGLDIHGNCITAEVTIHKNADNCQFCEPTPQAINARKTHDMLTKYYGKGERELKEDMQSILEMVEYVTGINPKTLLPSSSSTMDYEQQIRRHNFGEALANLKEGMAVARRGWNGKGMYLKLQVPDENSKMTLPYIYITMPRDPAKFDRRVRNLVPWLASQTDLLSDDWYVVCPE